MAIISVDQRIAPDYPVLRHGVCKISVHHHVINIAPESRPDFLMALVDRHIPQGPRQLRCHALPVTDTDLANYFHDAIPLAFSCTLQIPHGDLDKAVIEACWNVLEKALAPSPNLFAETLHKRLRQGIFSLWQALQGGRELDTAVCSLLGLGQGLTPSGDDFLAGIALALHLPQSPYHERLDDLRNALLRHLHRTHAISAANIYTMNLKHTALALVAPLLIHAQDAMTPETLWQLRKISFQGVSPDHSLVVYKTSQSDLATEKNTHKSYLLNTVSAQSSAFNIGEKSFIQWDKNGLYAFENGKIYISKDKGNSWREFYTIGKDAQNIKISPDGQKVAFSKEVQLEKIYGKDIHKDLPKTTAKIYTDLNHRHWDTWHEGKFNHIFVVNTKENVAKAKDLLEGKPFDTPQKPFGGQEDFVWSPDSKQIVYVTKTKSGKEYAISTNTDIFLYDLASGKTQNLSQGMMGYDVNPKFSPDGQYLLWQSMARDGYESDKNDIILMNWKTKSKTNLTKNWDESVTGDTFWDNDSKNIYFTAAFRGTKQLFSVSQNKSVKQITNGKFDVNSVFAQNKNTLFVNRNDVQHSPDFYSVELKNGAMKQVTNINADFYQKMKVGHSELKMVKTTDGKEMGVWFGWMWSATSILL